MTEEKKEQPEKSKEFEEFKKWRFGKPFSIMNKREKIIKKILPK